MRIIDKNIKIAKRGENVLIYPIGDVHYGSHNCAEKQLKALVKMISEKPNALWIGGGDMCECIKPTELRRWEPTGMPDWMFDGTPEDIKSRMSDIVACQIDGIVDIFSPIKDKCIGLIEGNHEVSLRKYSNNGVHKSICTRLGVTDLTSEAFVRLRMSRHSSIITTVMFITHGHGGGRTAGSEPNNLERLGNMVNADIILRGHSHQPCINTPVVKLDVSCKGSSWSKEVHAGNWGAWRITYKEGESDYASRACYKPQPLLPLEIEIRDGKVNMRFVRL